LALSFGFTFGVDARQDRVQVNTSVSAPVYQDWQDGQRQRTIPVKIYMPKIGSAPYPVVIFSHGLGGSREAAVYLGDYWSAHGYLCLFIQHPGSDSSVWQGASGGGKQAILSSLKTAANGLNLIARAQDVKFVLDQLGQKNRGDALLGGKLDLNRIALSGHSFGAGTTLAVAGQSFGLAGRSVDVKDDRIKAAIYLCPPVMGMAKTDPAQAFGNIQIPGLLLTGTEDNSPINDTKAEDRRIPFDGMKSTHQYLANFVGADHATFGGRSFRAAKAGDDKFHEMIEELTTKFLDATLKGDAAAWRWLDGGGAKAYLGDSAAYERK